MNRRKAKKKVKAELNLAKWPGGHNSPRLVRAVYLDMQEACALAFDHAILYGKSRPLPPPPCSHTRELRTGIHPKRKKEA